MYNHVVVCVGRGGGLSESMHHTPVGLSHTILNMFFVTSLLWPLLADWSVGLLRAYKKVT